jgi:hypothetical protein
MDDRIWCPNCNKWNFVKILKIITTKENDGTWIFKTKCKCTACKHKWTDIEKF